MKVRVVLAIDDTEGVAVAYGRTGKSAVVTAAATSQVCEELKEAGFSVDRVVVHEVEIPPAGFGSRDCGGGER